MNRTVRGLAYSFVGQGGSQFLRIALFVILARFFLDPEDFGVYNLALVLIGFSKILADFGFGKSIIQIEDPTQDDFSTAFWVNIIIGATLTISIFVAAPYISGYYKMPELENVLRVLSVSFLLNSATVVQKVILQREIDFKHLSINDLVSYISGTAVALVLGFAGAGVWCLVAFHLTMTLVSNIWLWLYLREWKPLFIISKASIDKILALSLYLFANDAVSYWSRNVDKSLIGRHYGDHLLGIYSQAFSLVLIPVTNISNVVSKVMFPSLAMIRNQKEKIGSIFVKMSKVILFVNGFVFGFVFLNAEPLIRIFLGTKWLEMTPVLQVFCFVGLITSMRTIQSSVYLALNKNRTLFLLNLVIRICTIAAFVWAASESYDMVVYTALGTIAVSYIATTAMSLRILGMQQISFIRSHLKPLLVIVASCGALYLSQWGLNLTNILVTGLIYVCTYVLCVYLVRDSAVRYMFQQIQKRRA